MLDDDKVVAAVCHGPAALLSATRPDGTWAFAGRKLAGFTNDEETQAGLAERAPWLLENRMREAGGRAGERARLGAVLGRRRQRRDRAEPGLQRRGRGEDRGGASTRAPTGSTSSRTRAAWTFKHEHGEPEGRFRTQKQAIEAAKEHGREHGDWELVIHGRNGRIRDAVAIH